MIALMMTFVVLVVAVYIGYLVFFGILTDRRRFTQQDQQATANNDMLDKMVEPPPEDG